ncbi:uncharacterized protein LOC141892220 [Acropora palmata]|uniref:uncharacterized protein LOC141892220 n=1 Tax=Acropora palmata TaxID=6131 RepID=UPI003D9FB259
MENTEDKDSSDPMNDRITTFASPTVLAAILDDNSVDRRIHVAKNMLDNSEMGRGSAVLMDSLDASLPDPLESTQVQGMDEVRGLDQVDSKGKTFFTNNLKSAVVTEKFSDLPKSSTPIQKEIVTKDRSVEKAAKPRQSSQNIIERNKEKAGKPRTTKSSYAQMHATKTKSKNKMEHKAKVQEVKTTEIPVSSGVEVCLGNEELNSNHSYGDFNEDSFSFCNDGDYHVKSKHNGLEIHDTELSNDSYVTGLHLRNHKHEPYYDLSGYNSTYNTGDPVSYDGEFQYAQLHNGGSVGPLHYSKLSTQSAPPGLYGYQRRPLISSLHHFEEDFNFSLVLPNGDFVDQGYVEKLPESSLHRKFSSEPQLEHSGSALSQKLENVQRNNHSSGGHSTSQPSLSYKPYSLKDYQSFMGTKVKQSAGGLGPNIDTDDYKERVKKVIKQRDYATMLRAQHSTMKKQKGIKGPVLPSAGKPERLKEAEMKRQAALNYAKNVPKPKQMVGRKVPKSGKDRPGKDDDQEITVLELLRLRHEQEKKEVDSIRKDLASKLRL